MISCIIPTYNRPDNALSTIESIYNQTIFNKVPIEIIVVNDGSTEDYSNIKNLKNIKYIELEENSKSVSIPRAIGISYAIGSYIAHMDDDVVNFKNKLELLYSKIIETNTNLCYGSRITVDLQGNQAIEFIDSWDPRKTWGIDGGQFIYKNLYNKIPYVFCRRACDYETAKAIANYDYRFSFIKDPVCAYIWHGKNRSLDNSTITNQIYPRKFSKYFNKLNYILPEKI
jgi:glycosyltransferase involved in cell wall biosynthesis